MKYLLSLSLAYFRISSSSDDDSFSDIDHVLIKFPFESHFVFRNDLNRAMISFSVSGLSFEGCISDDVLAFSSFKMLSKNTFMSFTFMIFFYKSSFNLLAFSFKFVISIIYSLFFGF